MIRVKGHPCFPTNIIDHLICNSSYYSYLVLLLPLVYFTDEEFLFVNSVFVFFPDEKDLFVHENKGGFIMKNSYQFVPLTLPCRVSDPEVQVKLLKPGNIEVPLENYAITFDPKIGFYIEFPSFQLVGMLQCAAILRNTVQETLNIYVNYIGNV